MKTKQQSKGVALGADHRSFHTFGKPQHVRTMRGAPSRSRHVPHVGAKQKAKAA